MIPPASEPHPLYRVRLHLRRVDELHRPAGGETAGVLDGVARVWASLDEPVPFVLDPHTAVAEPLSPPELRLAWQAQRDGRTWTLTAPEPQVEDALRIADDGRPGYDLLAILAREVRRLRGE